MNSLTILKPLLLINFISHLMFINLAEDNSKDTLKIITYNVLYGFNHGQSKIQAIDWIINENPDVMALQELKGYNSSQFKNLARQWNHNYSYLFDRPGAIQPIGISSNQPITKIKEVKDTKSDRGYLIAKTQNIYFIIVHLHPNKVKPRLSEMNSLLKSADSILELDNNLTILGDFNAMSPFDETYASENLTERLEQRIEKNKCADLSNNCTSWDYSVIQKILDANFIDVSYKYLENKEDLITHKNFGTFPTTTSENISDKSTRSKNLHRLDYVFMNSFLAKKVIQSNIYQESKVEQISDHYPVIIELNLSK